MTEYDEIIDHLTDVVIQSVCDCLQLDVKNNQTEWSESSIRKLEKLKEIRRAYRVYRTQIEGICDRAEEWRLELQEYIEEAAREKLTGETNHE